MVHDLGMTGRLLARDTLDHLLTAVRTAPELLRNDWK
jgi:hypothetical protein